MKKISELILRMQPYASELKNFCRINADFANALKTLHSDRFISFGAIVTSFAHSVRSTPDSDPDQVIGMFVYDIQDKSYKQDFIVNIETKYKEFRIYTRFKGSKKSGIIRDISHFYQEYPMYSKDSHHPSFGDIPDEIKPSACRAVTLANKLFSLGGPRKEISDEEYRKIDAELCKLGW